MNWSRHLPDAKLRLIRLVMVSLLLLLAGLPVARVRAAQTQTRTVLGQVVNGTPGGSVPTDLTVTLHTFSEMEEDRTYTTNVTEEGAFRFEDVSYDEGQTFVARVVYGGVTYVSEFVTVKEEQEAISLPVTVYETTGLATDVVISQLHLFVSQLGDRVQVGEYAVIANAGTRTYVGVGDEDVRTTWTTTLPESAENLRFDGAELGGRFVALDDGFADTRPVPPGEASVETSFTYEFPLQEGIEIAQSFDVPVQAVVLVLPEGDWGLRGAGISSEGTLDTQMGAAISYTAGPLDAGEPLAFTIIRRASRGSETPSVPSSNGLAIGVVALILAGGVVTLMWHSPSPGPVPEGLRSEVEAVAALDRDFESGRITERAYRDKRRALKRCLGQMLSDQLSD